MTQPTLEKFLDDVKHHEITVYQNNGVYRHLTFATPNDCNQHFNITTFPDHLVITGNMGALIFFHSHYDLFDFFRNDDLKINPDDWAEKIESTSYEVSIDIYSEFDIDEVKTRAQEYLDDFIRDNELSDEDESALRFKIETSVLSAEYEHEIIDRILNFGCYGFDFEDFEWWDCRTHRYRYIWLCYAIVWGIKKFDEASQ